MSTNSLSTPSIEIVGPASPYRLPMAGGVVPFTVTWLEPRAFTVSVMIHGGPDSDDIDKRFGFLAAGVVLAPDDNWQAASQFGVVPGAYVKAGTYDFEIRAVGDQGRVRASWKFTAEFSWG